MNVAAYTRVSSREQANEGLSLPAQARTLGAECEARGWQLGALVADKVSTRKHRPVFERLLERLDEGEFDVLMGTRLDRLSRSTAQFALLLDRAKRHGWQVVMLDPAVDTTTPYGRAFAEMGAVFAQLERALISQRTREALAEARAQGTFRPGEHLRYDDTDIIEQIVGWARPARGRGGLSANAIAARLNAQGTPPPGGGDVWHPRTVGRIIHRERGQDS